MKKKIGEIYHTPIIIGNKNLKTKNEIHVDELGGGSASYKYIDVSEENSTRKENLLMVSSLVRFSTDTNDAIATVGGILGSGLPFNSLLEKASAVVIDLNSRQTYRGEIKTQAEIIALNNIDIYSLKEITEEEFYTI